MSKTEANYWEKYWDIESRPLDVKFLFDDLISKFPIRINSYFEFGCAPGSVMAFFNKRYGCRVEGVDFIDSERIRKFLEDIGVDAYQVYQSDALEFSSDKTYDFVGSYGFIEHFDDADVSELIQKHKELVSADGYLCITVPNMRFLNYFISYVFSRDIIKNHNLKIMDIDLLKKLILDDDFEEVYADYYLTSLFQANGESQRLKKYPQFEHLYRLLNSVMRRLRLDNIPNKFMSPYIVVLAKRRCKVRKKQIKDNLS